MDKTEIRFSPGFIILLILAFLLIPLKITLSWFCAVIVHELGHLLCIRLLKKDIYEISLGLYGARIKSEPMTQKQEIIAALAGPLAGLLLVIFMKYIPTISLFAFVQTACNIMPVYPMDGGRILLGALRLLFSQKHCRILYKGILSLIFTATLAIGVYVSLFCLGKPLVMLVLLFLAIRIKSSCKQSLQEIQ